MRGALPRYRRVPGPRVRDRWERMARSTRTPGYRVKSWDMDAQAMAATTGLASAVEREAHAWARAYQARWRGGTVHLSILTTPTGHRLVAEYVPDRSA